MVPETRPVASTGSRKQGTESDRPTCMHTCLPFQESPSRACFPEIPDKSHSRLPAQLHHAVPTIASLQCST
ncbi:hypothetical protein DSO57_1010611 [Entomophthora muscae]|uniref:Uncharacterized protein n=1 Tax=Entomophthora muscae TaxID=34485 RepID=A0ACC2RLA0_9FUNG|nr:hypothetical protein DSO57_1010611 [Entomophthora muscae]